MPLSPGDRLGAYEILEHAGSGGMGDVYRARDSRLGRDVAIKLLPDVFTSHPDKLARLKREARMLAALSNPGIAAIYDIEKAHETTFLVLEYVPGQTLADILAHKSLSIADALRIALEIARAVEAAHEHGIIHRDLKPANVKITPDNTVKLLDFGLAKSMTDDGSGMSAAASVAPTITAEVTFAGVVLGTPAYMSPEQAGSKPVDKRTDIWSFGVILYEMLAGVRPFAGKTTVETLADVMHTEPRWSALPPETPDRIRTLLRRCLDRDRSKRLRDIGEARIALEECSTMAPGSDSRAVEPRRLQASRTPWLLSGVLAGISAIALWMAFRNHPTESRPVMQFDVDLGPQADLSRTRSDVILSPDATRLVYRGNRGGIPVLYTRTLDQPRPTILPGTEGANTPFFSPDGQWIGFFSGRQLKTTSVHGGGATPVCEAPNERGGSWGDNNAIIAALDNGTGLSRISPRGGAPEVVTRLRDDESTHRWPQVLPGSHAVLFTASTTIGGGFDEANIEVQSLRTGERRTLVRGGHYGRYAASGHLLYTRRGVLHAAPHGCAAAGVDRTGDSRDRQRAGQPDSWQRAGRHHENRRALVCPEPA